MMALLFTERWKVLAHKEARAIRSMQCIRTDFVDICPVIQRGCDRTEETSVAGCLVA